MAGGRFILRGPTAVPRPKVGPPFRVFVLSKILIASRAKGNLFNLITFLTQNHKLLWRASWCLLRFVKASVLLSHILDLTGR
jgi:hypothetical protein